MKSVLCLALLVALVAANPSVHAFKYGFADWFTTQWDLFILGFILPWFAFWGYFGVFFGSGEWYNTESFAAISGTWALPAYESQGYNNALV
jgi:hypothetical protein